jgi:hypothetical protein
MKKIESILEKFNNDDKSLYEDRLAQAQKEIWEVVKKALPNPKQGIKFHSGRLNSELSPHSPKDNQKVGYNKSLADTQENLKKLFEEEIMTTNLELSQKLYEAGVK